MAEEKGEKEAREVVDLTLDDDEEGTEQQPQQQQQRGRVRRREEEAEAGQAGPAEEGVRRVRPRVELSPFISAIAMRWGLLAGSEAGPFGGPPPALPMQLRFALMQRAGAFGLGGPPPPSRLTAEEISMLPTNKVPEGASADECCVCMDSMEPGQEVRRLACMHVFHLDCSTEWLSKHSTQCPVCKHSALPPGMARAAPPDPEEEYEDEEEYPYDSEHECDCPNCRPDRCMSDESRSEEEEELRASRAALEAARRRMMESAAEARRARREATAEAAADAAAESSSSAAVGGSASSSGPAEPTA